jgi:acyl-CoA synthetase (NDP forming)
MPPISSKTREELANLVGEAGTISRNPIDLSQALSRGFSTLIKAIGAVARDPVTELILIQEDVDVFLSYLSWNEAEEMADFLIDLRGRQNKTIVVVLPPGSTEPERLEVEQRLLEASIPVFPTMERAARAIARMSKFPQIAPGER